MSIFNVDPDKLKKNEKKRFCNRTVTKLGNNKFLVEHIQTGKQEVVGRDRARGAVGYDDDDD